MNTQNQCNTVVILCAGSGSRLKPYTNEIHKALLPINFKAILSKIIDSFPKNFKFIIPVGSKKDQIIYFCKTVHKEIDFKFVNVKNFNNKGSGPGLSLLKCKKYIKSAFYLTTCDTFFGKINFDKDKFLKKNWVAISKKNKTIKSKDFCCFKVKQNKIEKIYDKKSGIKNFFPFIGLCKIHDYKIFFKYLSKKKLINNERQISNGLNGLLKESILYYKSTSWYDIGNRMNYEIYKKKFENFDFSKKNELLYLYKPRLVGKFFLNEETSKLRFKRAKLLKGLTPKLISKYKNFYFYSWFKGKTLYEKCHPSLFSKLLETLQNKIWLKKHDIKNFDEYCKKFYKLKTLQRLKDFSIKYAGYDRVMIIDKVTVPKINNILSFCNWNYLAEGTAVNFHGDLQFDNIIFNSEFKLIDWRESFSESQYGDIYYDFAKLKGGLIINYNLVKKNNFSFLQKGNNVKINFPNFKHQKRYIKILNNFIQKNGYDLKKVDLIVSIIFLNMAPLHNYPFDKALFCYGKKLLWNNINN